MEHMQGIHRATPPLCDVKHHLSFDVGDFTRTSLKKTIRFLTKKRTKQGESFEKLSLNIASMWLDSREDEVTIIYTDLDWQKHAVRELIAAFQSTQHSIVYASINAGVDASKIRSDSPILPVLVTLWGAIVSLPSLQRLEHDADLSYVPLSGNLLTGINANKGLKYLGLHTFGWKEDECRQIAELVRTNRALEFVRIFVDPRDGCDDQHVVHIIDALKQNSTLKILKLVFKILTLVFKRLMQDFFSFAIQKAFFKMLETDNMTLQLLHCDDGEMAVLEPMKAIESLTRLNKHGRKELLKNDKATRHDWVDLLTVTNDSVHGIYHLLSMNPSLCDIALRTPSSSTQKRRVGHSDGKSPRKAARTW